MFDKVNFLPLSSNKQKNAPAFKSSQAVSYPQVKELPSVTQSYAVKTPMAYTKVAELNLPFNMKAHCYKLASGQRVVVVPKEGETVLKTYVGTGSMNEPDRVRGISHYIEHNLFNGSEGLEAGEFFDTASKMGAYTNASTGYAYTDYVVSSNLLSEGDLEKEIKIHSSMLESPKFAVEMLEKEKGIINSEINMYEGNAFIKASNLTLKNLYNIESSSSDLVAGTTDNITKLTRDDVVDYYNNNYYPANMVTVITGEVDPDEAMALVSKYFAGTNKNTHPRKFQEFKPIEKTMRQDITSDKTKQTLIQIGFNGQRNDDVKNAICFNLISALLTNSANSRLKESLKPYGADAGFLEEKIGCRPQDPVMHSLCAETNEENCEKVLQELFNGVHSVIVDKNYDLEALKKQELNLFYDRMDTSLGINYYIGHGMLDGNLDIITNYENIMKSITKEDLSNFAKEYLNLNRAAVTVVHPEKKNTDVSFTGTKQAINETKVNRYRAANNFEILTNESSTNLAFISLGLKTQNDVQPNPVAPLVLTYILKEGSKLRDRKTFQDDISKRGIDFGAIAGRNVLKVNANCSYEDLNKALESALEVLYNPNITSENFDYAKKRVEEMLMMSQKNPNDKLNKELFPGLPAGFTNQDMLDGLKSLTIDDIKSLHKNVIENAQGSLTVSAPFKSHPELLNNIFTTVSALPNFKPQQVNIKDTYKHVTTSKVLTDTDTKEQAEIVEAFKFKTNRNLKDDVTVDLLNKILGGGSSSRLFNDLREKQQLAYSVRSKISYVGNSGVLKMHIGTTTDNPSMGNLENVQKSIDGFNKHVKILMQEKVTQEELNNVKLEYKNDLLSCNETTRDKNSSLYDGLSSPYGPLTDNEILKVIDTITVEDIYNAANYIFSGKPIYSIVATEKTLKANEEYLKSLEG